MKGTLKAKLVVNGDLLKLVNKTGNDVTSPNRPIDDVENLKGLSLSLVLTFPVDESQLCTDTRQDSVTTLSTTTPS